MKFVNLFYVAVLLVGAILFFSLWPQERAALSFFGFAESKETELNYNYSIVVDKILVTPGQQVNAGDTLLFLYRKKSKETLSDQDYRISELRANEAISKQRKENELEDLNLDKKTTLAAFEGKVTQLQNELAFKKRLSEGLHTIKVEEPSYKPLEEEIQQVLLEKRSFLTIVDQKIEGLQKELRLGSNPYSEQVRRLEGDKAFEESQKIQQIVVTAPMNGLIGNIVCKEEEHIPAYRALMTFYEPHSGIIKGYVHEDLTYRVQIGDRFSVSSLKVLDQSYVGTVTGLGSRIVEIPTRLRKVPELKTYGREVLVEIPKDNAFLQSEKVSLSIINGHEYQ